MKFSKRVAAIIGIILMLSLYIVSFVSAFLKNDGLFISSIFAAVLFPIMIWGFITVYKLVHKKEDIPEEFDAEDTSSKQNEPDSSDQ